MKQSIVFFESKDKAAFKTEPFQPELTGKQVLVKADYDLISAGTELANYHHLPNTVTAEHGFPHYPGYSVSGHVVAVGPEAKQLQPGDNVVVHWGGHRAYFVYEEDDLFKVPAGIDPKIAACAHLASFAFLGVRKLELQLGEAVMIAGLGLLGQFAVQIARQSGGCPVLACDFSPERRALALKLGADAVFDPRDPGFQDEIKKWTDGKGPAGVVEVTGFISALQQALEYVAWQGRISLLGCTRISDQAIDFYRYVHRRGVMLIGSHTMTRPHQESRPGQWTEFDDYATFFKLVQTGRLQVEPIISEVVSPRDAEAIYHRIGSEKNPPCGLLLDWRNID